MQRGIDVRAFASQATLAPELAAAVGDDLRLAINARGRARLAVSGGTTPVPFFTALRQADLDWSRVAVTLVDERWVDADHADSNAALVQRHLLVGAAAGATFQPLKNAAASAADGCLRANSLVSPLCPLDVAVLGMGADGHTASWFPGASNLAQALDADRSDCCVALMPPGDGCERLSLSFSCIRAAGRRYLYFTGANKWATLERALLPGPVAELPVRALLAREARPLHLFYAVHDTLPEATV